MRAAIVGTGARAQMWARELRRHGDLVALADTNPARLTAFQRLIAEPSLHDSAAATTPAGSPTSPAGILAFPAGTSASPAGTSASPAGASATPTGASASPAGAVATPTEIHIPSDVIKSPVDHVPRDVDQRIGRGAAERKGAGGADHAWARAEGAEGAAHAGAGGGGHTWARAERAGGTGHAGAGAGAGADQAGADHAWARAERAGGTGHAGAGADQAGADHAWAGAGAPRSWVISGSADVAEMLRQERVDVLVVCSPDATHDEYIIAGLEAGAHVITEKPMTTSVQKCRRILDAQKRTGAKVTVAFNYRYHPVYQQVKETLPRIGEVSSVHFEWLLDVRHGADYFRRWHRDRAQSGGLLVHKATHHFDLINWWLGTTPEQVSAQGKLFFYGEAGARHGYDRGYTRAHGATEALDDPFALSLLQNNALKELYLDAEVHDGYHRDLNVFGPGVSIEDDLAVLVRYANGATMSYHLTAFAPWEGLRIAFNGSKGRLELDLTESDHVAPGVAGAVKGHSAALHGAEAAAEQGGVSMRLRPFWTPPQEIPVVPYEKTGHGGADTRMVAAIFTNAAAPTAIDGARSLLTGLAASESIRTQGSVRASDLLDLSEWES